MSRGRSVSKPSRDEMGVKNDAVSFRKPRFSRNVNKLVLTSRLGIFQERKKLKNKAHKAIRKQVGKKGLKGTADRFIGTKMPKHLYSGKRKNGKTDRR